jgi:hypothetical protein
MHFQIVSSLLNLLILFPNRVSYLSFTQVLSLQSHKVFESISYLDELVLFHMAYSSFEYRFSFFGMNYA